jgi:hypothetical protein
MDPKGKGMVVNNKEKESQEEEWEEEDAHQEDHLLRQ